MKSYQNNNKQLLKTLRLRTPYGAAKRVAKKLGTTHANVRNVVHAFNNGDNLYSKKNLSIIKAIKQEISKNKQ
jgi:transcriptional regulator